MLCIGNFYCRKLQFWREYISCSPHEHAHTLNILGSGQNANPPFVLYIRVCKYACVRACECVTMHRMHEMILKSRYIKMRFEQNKIFFTFLIFFYSAFICRHDTIWSSRKYKYFWSAMGIDLLPYNFYKGSEVSDETVWMRRLVWALSAWWCEKYPNLVLVNLNIWYTESTLQSICGSYKRLNALCIVLLHMSKESICACWK